MNIKVLENLDPICEILGLLYISNDYDKITKLSIEALNKEGINGELFVKKNSKVIDKYVKTFNKYKVINHNDILFFEEDEVDIYLILASVLINNRNVIEDIDKVTNEELKKLIIDVYNDQTEESIYIEDVKDIESTMEFLKGIDASESGKWKLMIILANPKDYYIKLIKLINDNKKAYEEAYKSVEKSIDKLTVDLIKYVNSDECDMINNTVKLSKDESIILPTLAFAASLFVIQDIHFIGLLYELVYKESIKVMGNKGELVMKLKALSDNSKLEIITILKAGSKYNLEIAEALNLTPATVSYHMGSLLECGMVAIEKKQGKVYYFLNEPGLNKFVNELNSVLF